MHIILELMSSTDKFVHKRAAGFDQDGAGHFGPSTFIENNAAFGAELS
jgi:hypothetical protein